MPLTDKEILTIAHRRYDSAKSYWSDFQNKTTEIMRFISGDQWNEQARQSYESAGFAAMTSNRIPTFLRQITNEIRKNTPEIKIDPLSETDKDKANAVNEIVRNIQCHSNAKNAFTTAVESAVSVGIGYFKITTKYVDDDSMDQEIVIEPIKDTNIVMIDPNHVGRAGEDCEYVFITKQMSKAEYLREYAGSKLAKNWELNKTSTIFQKFIGWISAATKWTQEDNILIIEYYYKDHTKKTLYQLVDQQGNAFLQFKEEMSIEDTKLLEQGALSIANQRQVDVQVVKWCKLNDIEVLEETEIPGRFIPIITVKADEYWVAEKRKLIGSVEAAIEGQVQLNYAMSWRNQMLQMSPKAPYIGTAEQFATFEQQWANINVSNQAYIPFNADPNNPNPPMRDVQEVPIQAATVLAQSAAEDMRSIFGVFDPTKQQTSAPESGKAILARQDESYNSNYHIYDAISYSMQHGGLVIVEMIPKIYDTARTVQALGADGKKKSIAINQPNEEGVVEYDMNLGKYSVSVQAGPSFGTRQQETVEAGIALLEVYPNAAPAIIDIIARNSDLPDSDLMADSLLALAPPQVIEARKTDKKDSAALVPQLQSQLASMKQQLQQMQVEHQAMAAKLQDKSVDLQIEIMKSKDDENKVKTDAQIKREQFQMQERQAALEYQIKQQELALQQKQFEFESTHKLIQVNADHHTKTVEHLDKITQPPETEKTGMEGDLK